MSDAKVGTEHGPQTVRLTDEQWAQVERDNDVTLYWRWPDEASVLPSEIFEALCLDPNARKPAPLTELACRYEEPVLLVRNKGENSLAARSVFTRSWGGQWISATCRITSRTDSKVPGSRCERDRWPPSASNDLVPSEVHAEQMWQCIFPRDSDRRRPEGAVIIAGGTGSGKSSVAKAFVFRVMQSLVDAQIKADGSNSAKGRFPHLVTIEDPIEDWSLGERAANLGGDPRSFLKYGMCLTARHCPKDVRSLSDAILDARRQTPSCLYVGEIRIKDNWLEFLEFAGSGHLIVTTMHAASVREAIGRLLAACRATSPAARRQHIGFVKGIVHLRGGNVRGNKVFFPSIWLGNAEAMNSLVSVGLSSVAPNRSFHIGRERYFAKAVNLRDPAALDEVRESARAFDIAELRSQ
jgi:hypothetical protein